MQVASITEDGADGEGDEEDDGAHGGRLAVQPALASHIPRAHFLILYLRNGL
jgi:hypothetical protein